MELEIHVVDAFTDVIFKGNSVAVIMTEEWLSVDIMQSIAIENNLSETAFVKIIDSQHYEIRWFSPITEIDFCGHATLAASFVIFANNNTLETINFFAKAVGDLSVTKMANGYIQMSFPNMKPAIVNDVPIVLVNALSIRPMQVLLNDQAYFVVYENETDVHNVVVNNDLLKQLAPFDVVVTAKGKSSHYDFVSRYFWPANGGDEDTVTGSIHSGLAPFWAEQLNKAELVAYQASKRGGKLLCRVEDSRIYISGKAIQYLTGTITV